MSSQKSSGGGYTIKSSGINSQVRARSQCVIRPRRPAHTRPPSQGNHYCNRDYGPDAPNQNAYHYSNANGSYYYSNPNGST